jgi:small subunit ribosomal protein S6
MKRYETIFIIFPDLADEDQQNIFGKIKDLIPQEGGTILNFDEWGMKNLAYEIKKQTRGYYAYIDYTGGGTLVKELERVMRIDDRVMKYMTVLTDEGFDPASVATDAESTSTETPSGDSSEGETEQTVTDTNSEEGV